jgi:23S rRNA (uracil1939-C5)-methyltransferase
MEQFTISAMTFGPYGVGHLEGATVLTPNVAPGDLIEAQITVQRRGSAAGRVIRVVRPGPMRREPPCAYLPQCGGCDWQQIDYPAQVRLKAELLVAEFRRGLGVELPIRDLIEPAPVEWGYRARIRLAVSPGGELGYRELASHRLVPIQRCLVAAGEIETAGALARAMSRRFTEIETVFTARGQVLIAHLRRAPTAQDAGVAERTMAADQRITGIVLRSGSARIVVGDAMITVEAEPGCVIEAAADHFSQVNHAQNAKLVGAVMALAQVRPGTSLLDLFCGAGNFSLPAARRGAAVTGVDADAAAIVDARTNALRMQLRGTQFIALAADETARFLERAKYRPEVVILDPPRTGAAGLMETIATLRAARLIYVSCDPPTMTRDIAKLAARGYRVGDVRGFDFFPHTHHIEAVAELLLT